MSGAGGAGDNARLPSISPCPACQSVYVGPPCLLVSPCASLMAEQVAPCVQQAGWVRRQAPTWCTLTLLDPTNYACSILRQF